MSEGLEYHEVTFNFIHFLLNSEEKDENLDPYQGIFRSPKVET